MFLGLRTVIYPVRDLDTAKRWWSTVLGIAPYFDQPYYVGFNVGGYELALDPHGHTESGTGPVVGTSRIPVAWLPISEFSTTTDRALKIRIPFCPVG